MTDPPPDTVALLAIPALLSVATAAQILDCSPQTVRRRITDGELEAHEDHGRLVIRGDDLRAYIDALERVGPARRRRRPPRPQPLDEFDFMLEPVTYGPRSWLRLRDN